MTRGTTPTMSFSFDEVELSQIKYAEITINQKGKNILIKKLKRSGKVFYANFTEEETLQLQAGNCEVQTKIKLKDGNVIASEIEKIVVNEVLHGEVMLWI